ncbi:MAG TPA: HAMP domain-containing histidine kinase [Candidatus Tetragenococcus pullicola]|nr:HAMP domain-containing histidine kinase [Candidatus Tetragenococcus pullicola]
MEKFQQTTEEKKRTDQRNKQMLASISHDFRTPLTSMLGYIQMVDKKNLNSKDVKYLSIIEERTQLISKLIDEFYLLSLLDADDYKITKEACNPVRLVQEQVAQYYEELSQSFKQIEIELEEERIVIQTSIIDFNRIVQNLIKNAYNHGTGTFKVQLKKETNQLLFIFENQVPSENEIDVFRLFDRNYQGNHARISGNAGLGLSIAKELSEKLGFRLSATAEKDWLQFQLVIPVEEWKMRSFNVEKTQYQNTR